MSSYEKWQSGAQEHAHHCPPEIYFGQQYDEPTPIRGMRATVPLWMLAAAAFGAAVFGFGVGSALGLPLPWGGGNVEACVQAMSGQTQQALAAASSQADFQARLDATEKPSSCRRLTPAQGQEVASRVTAQVMPLLFGKAVGWAFDGS